MEVKNHNENIVTVVYGDEHEWGPALDAWLANTCAIIEYPVKVISMGEQWVRNQVKHDPRVADLHEYRVPKDQYHGQLNPSGLLLAEAARKWAPCLVVTLDCEVMQPIGDGAWSDAMIASGVNHYMLHKKWNNRHYFPGGEIEEYNCAVQYMGNPEVGDAFDYHWLNCFGDQRAKTIPYWEQIVWSLVYDQYKKIGEAVDYPQEMNWSAGVPEGNASVVIRHYHGRQKKDLWKKWGLA